MTWKPGGSGNYFIYAMAFDKGSSTGGYSSNLVVQQPVADYYLKSPSVIWKSK